MKPSRLTLLFILLLAISLSACSDDDNKDDTDNKGDIAALPLIQTLTIPDLIEGNITIKYPENWSAIGENSIIIANGQTTLAHVANGLIALDSGEVLFQGYPFLRARAVDATRFTPAAMIDDYRERQAEQASSTPVADETAQPAARVSPNENITIAGKPGVKAPFIFSNGQVEGAVYTLQYSEDIILMLIGAAHPGEWENYAATAEAVLASFEFQTDAATEAATEAP